VNKGETHGHREKQPPLIRYNRDRTDSDEADLKSGEQVVLWLALDPCIRDSAELWRRSHMLGTLTVPITVGRKTMGIQVQL
jgi:hypothetical protein